MRFLTEKDARAKWCPFARVVEIDDHGAAEPLAGHPVGNRSTAHTGHPHARCIGEQCMAWRNMSASDAPVQVGYCELIRRDRDQIDLLRQIAGYMADLSQ